MGKALTLSEDQREAIARGLFTISEHSAEKGELHGLCPIHHEKNPSFSYNYKKDLYHCLSCGADGDLIKLFSIVNSLDEKEGFKRFCTRYGVASDSVPRTPDRAGKPAADQKYGDGDLKLVWNKFPPLPESWIKRLEETRGWTKEALQALDIRQQTYYQKKETGELVQIKKPERVAIPIRDEAGVIRNIRLYKPGAQKMKIISWGKGFGKARLFPAFPGEKDPVLLCEGEQDTICAISHGYNAITQTSKVKVWADEHKKVFAGRDVVIVYDADRPGETYAAAAAHNLAGVARSIRVLLWPAFMCDSDGKYSEKKGEDITDFFVKHHKTPADLNQLIFATPEYDRPKESALGSEARFFEFGINGRVSFKPRLLAEYVLNEIKLVRDPETDQLYRWIDDHWELFPEDYVERRCGELLGNEAQKTRIKDAAYQTKIFSSIPHDRKMNDRHDWVSLSNCMFNLKTGETVPHDPDFYATYSLGIEFHADKRPAAETWIKYLNTSVQTSGPIMQLQEFMGYCFTRDTRFGKCLLLLGPGSDGKSIFIKTLRKLVGVENCSAVSFQALEDQFLRSSLYNKLLNISTEVGSKAIESQFFKAIITGDPIEAAFKHKNSFTFTPFCKQVFAANKLPRVLDNSDGYFRRVLPVQFKRQFLEDDPDMDPDLEEKIEAELSGIFEWGIIGLHRLWKNKRFTMCDETIEIMQGYRRLNNPVMAFVQDSCVIGDDNQVKKDELYTEYKKYCTDGAYKIYNKENFFRELYATVDHLRLHRPRGTDGARFNVLKGIGLSGEFNA
jgi:putative DNA primase/helicase